MTDDLLIQKTLGGDNEAFEVLVSRYRGLVYSLAAKIINDKTLVQDCLQEVFFKVYVALPNFKNESSFYTWIDRIVVNTAINKSKKSCDFVSLDFDLDYLDINYNLFPVYDGMFEQEYQVYCRERRKIINRILNDIPDKQRESLVLKLIYGYSQEEIADRFSCLVGTVKSRCNTAKRELKDRLGVFANDI